MVGRHGDDLRKTIEDLKKLGFDLRRGNEAVYKTGTNIIEYGPNTKIWELYEEAIHHSVNKGLGKKEIAELTKQLRDKFRTTKGSLASDAAEEIFVKRQLLRRLDLDTATRQLLEKQIEKLRLRGMSDGY